MNKNATQTICLILAGVCISFAGCGGEPELIGIDPLGLMDANENRPRAEVELGDYEISIALEDTYECMHVTFTAVGLVPEDRKEPIEKLVEAHQTRLRDRIHTTVQKISTNQLRDPRFVWLKSELNRAVNDELNVREFKEIVFSGFSLERR